MDGAFRSLVPAFAGGRGSTYTYTQWAGLVARSTANEVMTLAEMGSAEQFCTVYGSKKSEQDSERVSVGYSTVSDVQI